MLFIQNRKRSILPLNPKKISTNPHIYLKKHYNSMTILSSNIFKKNERPNYLFDEIYILGAVREHMKQNKILGNENYIFFVELSLKAKRIIIGS